MPTSYNTMPAEIRLKILSYCGPSLAPSPTQRDPPLLQALKEEGQITKAYIEAKSVQRESTFVLTSASEAALKKMKISDYLKIKYLCINYRKGIAFKASRPTYISRLSAITIDLTEHYYEPRSQDATHSYENLFEYLSWVSGASLVGLYHLSVVVRDDDSDGRRLCLTEAARRLQLGRVVTEHIPGKVILSWEVRVVPISSKADE